MTAKRPSRRQALKARLTSALAENLELRTSVEHGLRALRSIHAVLAPIVASIHPLLPTVHKAEGAPLVESPRKGIGWWVRRADGKTWHRLRADGNTVCGLPRLADDVAISGRTLGAKPLCSSCKRMQHADSVRLA